MFPLQSLSFSKTLVQKRQADHALRLETEVGMDSLASNRKGDQGDPKNVVQFEHFWCGKMLFLGQKNVIYRASTLGIRKDTTPPVTKLLFVPCTVAI